MTITLNPYLNFRGQAREALDFYASVLGGTPTTMTFAEGGMAEQFPGEEQLLMHGQLVTDSGLTLMAADAPSSMPGESGSAISVSLSGGRDGDSETLAAYWEGLAAGEPPSNPTSWRPSKPVRHAERQVRRRLEGQLGCCRRLILLPALLPARN